MAHERVSRPLGRIAELLVENDARASLNEIRDLLQALDARAYWDGFQDGRTSADDRANEAAEREHESHFVRPHRAGWDL
jgi:hypothetical protein